jgi:hypothetical protein
VDLLCNPDHSLTSLRVVNLVSVDVSDMRRRRDVLLHRLGLRRVDSVHELDTALVIELAERRVRVLSDFSVDVKVVRPLEVAYLRIRLLVKLA